jgi:hypothetical protein
LWLGSLDIAAGTGPRRYRLSLEAVVQHLQARGRTDIRIALPIAPPHAADRYAVIRVKSGEVAHVYRLGRVFYSQEELPGAAWQAAGEQVLRRTPAPATLVPLTNQLVAFGAAARRSAQ